MATNNNWIATAHGNFSTAGNWSLGHAPTGDEIAMFSGNAFNCIVDQNVDCSGITVSGAYTGRLTATGYAFWINGNFNDNGTGVRDYGSGITMYAAASTLTFGANLTTVTATGCVVTMNTSNGTIEDLRSVNLGPLVIAANATITHTNTTSVATTYTGNTTPPLTFTNGGTLNVTGGRIFLSTKTSGAIVNILAGTPTIVNNGTGTFLFTIGANNITCYLPALTISGTQGYNLVMVGAGYTSGVINLSGNLNTGTALVNMLAREAPADLTINTNNYSITCGALTVGNASVDGKTTINFGSSIINCSSYAASNAVYTTGSVNINLQTSTINCSGNFTHGANFNVNPGTSTISILNSASGFLLTQNKYFNNLNLYPVTGQTLYSYDDINISGNLNVGSGNLTTISGIYLWGPTTTGTFASTIGTITTNSTTLNFNGSGCAFVDNKGITIKGLIVGTFGGCTKTGTGGTVIGVANSTPLVINDSGTFTPNTLVSIRLQTPGYFHTMGSGAAFTGTADVYYNGYAIGNCTVNALTRTTGRILFNTNTSSAVYLFSGNLNLGAQQLICYTDSVDATVVYTFSDGITVNAGAVTFGKNIAGSNVNTFNLGNNTTFNISTFGNYTTGPSVINFQSSTWNATGSWTFGVSNITVNQGTSTVNFSGNSTNPSIASNGKNFYNITSNMAASYYIQPNDSLSCYNLTINTGSIDASTKQITCSGNMTISGPNTQYLSGVLMTNPTGVFKYDSGAGTLTAGLCDLVFSGTANVLTDNKGCTLRSLTVGPSCGLTTNGSQFTAIQNYAGTYLTLGANSTFTNNCGIRFYGNGTTTLISQGASSTWNGTASTSIYFNTAGITITLPAITYTGSGGWIIYENTGFADTFTHTGAFNIGNVTLQMLMNGVSTSNNTWNLNNQNLTCGALTLGRELGVVNTTLTTYFGSGVLNISGLTVPTLTNALINNYLQGSTINSSGSISLAAYSGHLWQPGTSTIVINGASTITEGGKDFYKLVQNANISINSAETLRCYDFTIASGRYNAGGAYQITSGNFNINGGASHILPATITMTSPTGTFHLDSAITSITATSTDIIISGTVGSIIDDDKGVTFKTLTVGSGAILTTTGSATTIYGSLTTQITLNNNCTFTNNAVLQLAPGSAHHYLFSIGTGVTFNGVGNITVDFPYTFNYSLPAIVYTGSGTWQFQTGSGDHVLSLSGNLSLGNANLTIGYAYGGTGNSIFNANGYSVTCGVFNKGHACAGGSWTFNAGSGLWTIGSYVSSLNLGTTYINLQSSNWNCAGSWTYGSAHTVNPGTSTVNITNTSTVTANGKYLNHLNTSGGVANTITLADLINLSGNFTGASGALTISSGIAFYGPTTTGTFTTGLGTITGTNCALSFNASGHILQDNKTCTFKSLTLAASSTVTSNGANYSIFQTTTNGLVLGGDAVLTNTGGILYFRNSASGDFYTAGAGSSIAGTSAVFFQIDANSIACTAPAITYTGNSTFGFTTVSNYTGWTITLNGALNLGTLSTYDMYLNGTSTGTYNFNGQNLTCGTLRCGSNTATGNITINFSSGVISIASYLGTAFNSGTSNINFQTSQWTCTGSWTHGFNHTINAGSSIVNINPSANSNITSSGKAFATLNFSGSNPLATGFFVDTPIISGNLGVYNGSSVNSSGLNISITSGCYITTSGNFSASGIYTIGKDLTFGSGTVLNNSGMTLTLSGQAHTITTNGRNFPYTKIYDNSIWVGSGTIARMSLYAPTISTTHTWQAGVPYRFTSYTAGDWNGTDLNHQILFRSSAAGFQTTFYAPINTITRFTDYKDINNLGVEIDASDGTSTDTGNNYGINFGAAVVHPRRPHDENDVFFFIANKTFRY